MCVMKTKFCLFLIFWGNVLLAQDKMTFKQAINKALQVSHQIDSAKRKVSIQGLNVENTQSAFYPRLDFKSEHGVRKTNQDELTRPWVSKAGLELTETLYNGGTNITEFRISKLELESEGLSFAQNRDKLILDLVQAYFDLSQQRALLQESKKNQKLIQDQLNFVTQGFHAGLKQKKDVQRLKAKYQRSELDLQNAELEIKRLVYVLKSLVFDDVNTEADFESVTTEDVLFKNKKFEIHADDFYSVKIAKLNREIQDERLSLAKKRYSPEINLTSNISYGYANYLGHAKEFNRKGDFQIFAGLGVNFPIWDWGMNRNAIQKASEEKFILDNTLVQERNNFIQAVKNEKNSLEILEKEYGINKKLLSIEEESFVSLNTDYKKGEISYLDLINGLDDLSSARQSVISSFYKILRKQARLTYFQGKIYDWANN